MRGGEVAAHAEVEVGLALAADGGREVEHRVGLAPEGGAVVGQLGVEVARGGCDARVGREVGRWRCAVDQRDAGDVAGGRAGERELAQGQEGARQARAEKAGAAGDDDVHGVLSPCVLVSRG
ncbi:hypothetical protein D9M69_692500 [compost metagenome]